MVRQPRALTRWYAKEKRSTVRQRRPPQIPFLQERIRMTVLWLDFETFSETPIKDGVHRYAEKAEIMLFAWAIDDEPAEVWDCTSNAPCPRAYPMRWQTPT